MRDANIINIFNKKGANSDFNNHGEFPCLVFPAKSKRKVKQITARYLRFAVNVALIAHFAQDLQKLFC